MKILFTSHSSGVAGAETSLVNLVGEAVRRGHHGMVALPSEGALSSLLMPFSESFEVVILPSRLWMGRRYSLPVGLVRFFQAALDVPGYLRLLRNQNFEIVVVNSSAAPVPLIAAKLLGRPVILMVRESFMTNPMLKSLLPKSVIRSLLRNWSTDVIAISNYVASQFRYSNTVIYPQVGQEFLNFNVDCTSTRSGAGLKAVMFGTISPEKGQVEAIRAIRIALDRGTPLSLDIYGHGSDSDRASVERAIFDQGVQDVVQLRGPTNSALEAYRSADFSIVCSKNEAFGKVTAESILTGTPVVAFGRGGTSEILSYGGGLCTEPTPESLATAIISLGQNGELMQKLRRDAHQSPIRAKLKSSARAVLDRVELSGNS